MFSDGFRDYAREAYLRRLEAGMFGTLTEEITEGMARLKAIPGEDGENQALLMQFFYGTMPLCDAGDYAFPVFQAYAVHGLWLREHISWCRELPEGLFLHYVLYYRVNTEGITPCRAFFYEQLKERIQGLGLMETVLEVNYWCAEQAGYEASDDRTLSPMAVYRSGSGRCGEESAFVVSALRSVGIPARQVYTPWWAHCDDNHAWVEVYVEDGWHFLGACEPEESLDRGWFVGAASRALLVHSRAFSNYRLAEELKEACIGHVGSVWYYNSTPRYTRTRELKILVKDQAGKPAGGAVVSIEALNMADYRQVAELVADDKGRASISIGLGDLHLHARKGGWFGTVECLKGKEGRAEVILDRRSPWEKTTQKPCNCNRRAGDSAGRYEGLWEPPGPTGRRGKPLTPEQKARGRERRRQAEELREQRLAGLYDPAKAGTSEEEQEILKKARGNLDEIYGFLQAGREQERRSILRSLSSKDYRDVTGAVLNAFLGPPWEGVEQASDERLYERYVLCPRISYEELTPYPPRIRSYFTRERQEEFCRRPKAIWEYIEAAVQEEERETYPALSGTPVGCLRLGRGTSLGRKILFVAIARSLGIPARLNSVDQEPEFWQSGAFYRVRREERPGKGLLCLKAAAGTEWAYGRNYSLARLMEDIYTPLHYEEVAFQEGELSLSLPDGEYRLITTNRLPNGNQYVKTMVFGLAAGQQTGIVLSREQGTLADLMCCNELEDFWAESLEGERARLSSLLSEGSSILAFLEVGQEPTEHVLNEMLLQEGLLSSRQVVFLLEKKKDLGNRTLQAVLEALPQIRVYLDPGFVHAGQAARDLYVEPGELPLLAAVRPGLKGILGLCGYHVGSVELMVKILKEAERSI